MTGALDRFFEAIDYTDGEKFKNTKLEKVVESGNHTVWTLYLVNEKPLDVQVIESLVKHDISDIENIENIIYIIKNNEYNDEDIKKYFLYYLNIICEKNPAFTSIRENKITFNNKEIEIEVTNSVEERMIEERKDEITSWLDSMGVGATITTFKNTVKQNEIREEIEKTKASLETSGVMQVKTDLPSPEIKEGVIYGNAFENGKFTPICDLTEAKRGINVCAYLTDIKALESTRTDYKIFTLTLNDGNDEIVGKIFTTDTSIYEFLLKTLKRGTWYKFRGSLQMDSYLKKLVISIRSVMECDQKEMLSPKSNEPKEEVLNYYDDYPYEFDDIPPEDDTYSDAAFFANSDELPVYPQEIDVDYPEPEEEPIKKNSPKSLETTLLKNIISPVNYVVVNAKIFDLEFFESTKNNIKIITLKITDNTDSLVCKIFTKDTNEYKKYSKEIKINKWYKIEGQVKYDEYTKDLCLMVRAIEEISSLDKEFEDTSEIKRVELHTHTQMSQMDGVIDVSKYIETLANAGYKAVGITDHNGCQSFPDAFHKVNAINKGKEDKDKFKVLYGTELVMIEDSVNIVTRPIDLKSMDATYCVFDFETTGLNARGEDSIIEIGAVLIKNGEIIDRFDELIDPGKPLAKKITELTNITDDMLKGKENEETVVKRFMEFFKDYPMVAHNARFDVSFLESAYQKYNLGTFTNCVIDTLELSRTLDSGFARHGLSALVKRYNVPWEEDAHHRADYDAEGTALVLHKMITKMYNQNIDNIMNFNDLVDKNEIYKYGRSFHINILVKNKVGLKNLFKLISYANTKYLFKTPRILRSEIIKHREGLLIGSGCYESEVFIEAKNKNEEELSNIISFYDYVEVQPPEVYSHLIQQEEFASQIELENHIKKIVEMTKKTGKIIVATGDVHHFKREDKIYREIIVNQKVPGGGRHPLARGGITNIPSQHFRTTEEMLKDFNFLGEPQAKEIVIDNTIKIADMCEIVEVIIDTGGVPFSPKIENSQEDVTNMVYSKAHEIYGEELPEIISTRIENELKGIINGGFDVIYLVAQKLVKHSNEEGYMVGSRGSVGSSFVASMMDITEVNPLPAHYVCPKCKHSIFEIDGEALSVKYSCGFDLLDLKCPKCGEEMNKQGQDIPFATFLGFNADKVPDIDLNFSGDNQASAHEYTKVLFGVDNVYRAGTIGTVADKTAYGFVKGYCETKGITNMRSVEMDRLAKGCTGVKRTTGQHPGGIVVIPNYMDVFDFTPYQYPADDLDATWRTTHFDYHAIEEDVLKLDILGHDNPTMLKLLGDLSGIDVLTIKMDDKDTMSIFRNPDILGVKKEDIDCETGTLGIPEFGTRFVIKMLTETKPSTFAELIKISGLSHGTDVWTGNARDLIMSKEVEFKDVVGCRDDIMRNLISYGMEDLKAFKIMEFVRKGKASKDPETWSEYTEEMRASGVPEWYIGTCSKIKYMFPKAHAAAYVIGAFRIAWFKVHMPIYYYATYFSVHCNDFDIDAMCGGYDVIRAKYDEINNKGFDANIKESALKDELQVAMEMCKRGFSFKPIDLYKSHSKYFIIDEDNKSLIFPFRGLDGMGEAASNAIVQEREKGKFLSIEDVQIRAKVNATNIEKMKALGVFDGMSESNQLSLFDL